MKRYLNIPAILLVVLLAVPILPSPSGSWLASGQAQERKEVTVWVNTASSVYHCPGTRWYGKTKRGKYMGECEALAAGHRPAYGRRCGSVCKEGSSDRSIAEQSYRPQETLLLSARQPGGMHGR